jgi:hypothetical protein
VRLFDRAVEHVNCNFPAMLLVLVRRQFTEHSDCISNGRDNAVPVGNLIRLASEAESRNVSIL